MLYIDKPDYHIKIGIKDKKVIRVDWLELMQEAVTEIIMMGTDKEIKKYISKYLKQAIRFLNKKE